MMQQFIKTLPKVKPYVHRVNVTDSEEYETRKPTLYELLGQAYTLPTSAFDEWCISETCQEVASIKFDMRVEKMIDKI